MSDEVFYFGKHKGKKLSEVPGGYLRWMVNKMDPSPLPKDRQGKTVEEVNAITERMRNFIFAAEDELHKRETEKND